MQQRREGTNYYEILEVPTDATPSEIQKAYQRAKSTYSVDNPALYSMFSPEEAKELLRMIDEAYNVLSNVAQRKVYDETHGSGGHVSRDQAADTKPAEPIQQDAKRQVKETTPVAPASSSVSVSVSDSYTVRKKENADTTPVGMAKTQLSTYKVDDNFESEIAAATEFDGTLLQRIRLYKNISIDRLSESTRISRPYLMAVETNDFKSLPAAVFVRGFVVQMARYLGLEEQKVASSYMQIFKAGGGK